MSQTPTFPGDQPAGPSGGGSPQEKAGQVAQTAKESGTHTAQTAKHEAQNVAGEATNQARNLAHEGMNELRQQASTQQDKLVSGLRDLVQELRSMADNGGQQGLATEVVRQGADRTGQAADWLEQREPGDLVQELRRFGRERPGVFLAGAAIAGVLAGRLTRGMTAGDDGGGHDAASSTKQTTQPARSGTTSGPQSDPGPSRPGLTDAPYPPAAGSDPTVGGADGGYPLPGTPDNPVVGP